MAGKACAVASKPLAYALDKLSKNTLIDMLAARARAEVGEDADNKQVAYQLQRWLDPVALARKDRVVDLIFAVHDWARIEINLAEQAERYRQHSANQNKPEA